MELHGANGLKVKFISSNENMPKVHATIKGLRKEISNEGQMEISLNIRPVLIKERTKHTILSMLQIMAATLIIAIMHVLHVVSLDIWLEIVVTWAYGSCQCH